MKCEKCLREAVTFHGVDGVTHGYCQFHRCCAACGLPMSWVTGIKDTCQCKKPVERQDYLSWKRDHRTKVSIRSVNTFTKWLLWTMEYEIAGIEPGSRLWEESSRVRTRPGAFFWRVYLLLYRISRMRPDERYEASIGPSTRDKNRLAIGSDA